MTRRLFATAVFAGVAVLAPACRRPAPVLPPPALAVPELPPPISPWPTTLAAALRDVEHGRYDDAERLLVEFSVKHAGTPEGAESDFWRALLRTDPSNRGIAPREPIALYDAYLSGGPRLPRYTEALILRRVAEAMDSTRALLVTVRAAGDERVKARDEEIRRLNEIIDRTTAELERIKRRLQPRPQVSSPGTTAPPSPATPATSPARSPSPRE